MNTNPIRTASTTVPAGTENNPGTKTLAIAGEVFICVLASGPFRMRFDTRGVFDCISGAVIPVANGFRSVTFYNPSADSLLLQIGCGANGITFIPTNVLKAAPTYTKASDLTGGTAIAASGTKAFSGLDGFSYRKQITVQNLDAGMNLCEVQDGNGVSLAVLASGGPPWTLETSGVIKVFNPSGAFALSRVLVGETFYA